MKSQKEKPVVNIFWMRRDLRLDDNTALFHALKTRENVLPLFIFDPVILSRISNGADYRINFVYETLLRIKNELEKIGSALYVVHGRPLDVFKSLIEKYHVCSVYCNRNYEPYANHRDMEAERFLKINRTEFITYKDHVLFEKDELVKKDGKPYTVFTPYKNRFLEKLNLDTVRANKTSLYFHNFIRMKPLAMPTLESMGFSKVDIEFPPKSLPQSLLENYEANRDFPALNGTSRLSLHLRYGTVSIRKITALAMLHSQTFLSELIWRNFYSQILWFFPHVSTRAFKPAYDHIRWENDLNQFQAWCDGMTGYPLVDAGMRELNQTGFMHNRVRMVTASFLCKHLLIDWRWGETYFASKLNDYDLASNNGGWQWAAGSGCDAVPYFRIFNPELQAKRFDPDFAYIKKWVPEFGTDQYPAPVVEHVFARERAIARYKEGLDSIG
ncbi:MAG TPA: deoxyribodipyrimidine photo-lyase [Prolixibacteraceae bacterium]|nr:deoxyribodipyrimidine photo-lyase [Prolixibacteraceae bacterium]